MRKESGAPIYIISLNQPKEQTEELLSRIIGRPVTAVEGCYKGVTEWSVLVPSEDMSDALRDTLKAYEQACVLYLDGQRNAFLCPAPEFNYGSMVAGQGGKYIGELVSADVSQIALRNLQDYTKINGLVYYVR